MPSPGTGQYWYTRPNLIHRISYNFASAFNRRHILLRRSWPASKSSTHFGSNAGSRLPGTPQPGSPASRRSSSKYALNSGWTTVNAGPSPFAAIRAVSHFSCSSADGSEALPAKTRAAATACHSKTLNVSPAPTCRVCDQRFIVPMHSRSRAETYSADKA